MAAMQSRETPRRARGRVAFGFEAEAPRGERGREPGKRVGCFALTGSGPNRPIEER